MPFPLRFSALAALAPRFSAVAAPAVLVLLLTGACAAPPDTAIAGGGPVACSEPRPQVCTTIYAPVCAEHDGGRRETHASACNACADDTTLAYVDGLCEEDETP
ncbi:MAG: hypothetical protein AAGL66_06685 [Pseudomonadota bacterium]